MPDSILLTIRKLIGAPDDGSFDQDIIIHINTYLMVLEQLGIGPNGFFISDESAIWDDLLLDRKTLEAVKTYIYIKVKLVFDPPLNPSIISSLEKSASELEWRLNSKNWTDDTN